MKRRFGQCVLALTLAAAASLAFPQRGGGGRGSDEDQNFVLSLDTLKKTDEIEKLAKKIRSRLRHY
jgi:hypothetical protein